MTASTSSIRVVAVSAALVVVAGVAAIVLAARGDDVPRAGARVTVEGRAIAYRVDGSTDELESGDIVRAGDEVRVEDGTAVLELAAGGEVEGRSGFDGSPDSRILVGERPEVLAGEALLGGADGLDVVAAGTVVAVEGDGAAARVERGLSVRAVAYRGGLGVDSAGQERAVPALRQIGVATLGRPAARPDPLRWVAADPWDLRFLGSAIELTEQLEAVSRTFTAEAPPGAATSATLFAELIPDLDGERALRAKLADDDARPAGEALIGAAIAALAADDGDFADQWDAAFRFREDGAKWGLVALDRGVAGADLMALLADVLDRAVSPSVLALGGGTGELAGGPLPEGAGVLPGIGGVPTTPGTDGPPSPTDPPTALPPGTGTPTPTGPGTPGTPGVPGLPPVTGLPPIVGPPGGPTPTLPPPVTGVLAPVTSALAPITTVLAPVSSVLAPVTSVLAPVTTVLAPVSSVLAPVTSALAPVTSLVPLPPVTLPRTTVPPPTLPRVTVPPGTLPGLPGLG